eukprot:659804-Prorocentrum_minimum.AAC.1
MPPPLLRLVPTPGICSLRFSDWVCTGPACSQLKSRGRPRSRMDTPIQPVMEEGEGVDDMDDMDVRPAAE